MSQLRTDRPHDFHASTPSYFFKELLITFSASDHGVILYRADVFERTPFVRPFVRGGGYRSRTDDPLLAKQVL